MRELKETRRVKIAKSDAARFWRKEGLSSSEADKMARHDQRSNEAWKSVMERAINRMIYAENRKRVADAIRQFEKDQKKLLARSNKDLASTAKPRSLVSTRKAAAKVKGKFFREFEVELVNRQTSRALRSKCAWTALDAMMSGILHWHWGISGEFDPCQLIGKTNSTSKRLLYAKPAKGIESSITLSAMLVCSLDTNPASLVNFCNALKLSRFKSWHDHLALRPILFRLANGLRNRSYGSFTQLDDASKRMKVSHRLLRCVELLSSDDVSSEVFDLLTAELDLHLILMSIQLKTEWLSEVNIAATMVSILWNTAVQKGLSPPQVDAKHVPYLISRETLGLTEPRSNTTKVAKQPKDLPKRRFEFTDGNSSKFWEIACQGNAVTTKWGRIGTVGQSKKKNHANENKAQLECDKLIREKTGKGYAEA